MQCESMDKIGRYTFKKFTKNRQNIELIVKEGWRKHAIHAVIEIDVTDAREIIRKYKENTGGDISFTAWIMKCVSQALTENKILNSDRQGKKKIVMFEDVDIPLPVERKIGDDVRVMAYILRKVNEKSVTEITKEIRAIQKENIDESTQVLGKNLTKTERFLVNAPLFIKKIAIWSIRRNGLFKKKHMGTVGVTSIGMKGKFPGWIIPLGGTTSTLIAVGGITKKPGVIQDQIEIREYLHLTVTVDHDIVDGGPLARFVERLTCLMENAYGLPRDT